MVKSQPLTSGDPPLDLTPVWSDLARRMKAYMDDGFGHLLTEDVLRFEVVKLVASRFGPADLETEVRIPDVGVIDLAMHGDRSVAIEFKYPRDPGSSASADTMTLGELLKDVYKVALSGFDQGLVVQLLIVQLLDSRLRG